MQLSALNEGGKDSMDNNFLSMAHERETESRSPPHTGGGRGVRPSQPAISLAFSIERILSEDFGKRDRETHKGGGLFNSSPGSESSTASVGRAEEKSEITPNEIPIWVFCTRYSARASSGPRRIRSKKSKGTADQDATDGSESPRSRRIKKKDSKNESKRARTAFTNVQLQRLRDEFTNNRYLTEKRRQDLARDLQLSESQIKIWFQNKRAKMKKSGRRSPLALQLMAHGLYDHRTVPLKDDQTDERPKSSSSL